MTVTNTTPVLASQTYTSSAMFTTRATQITGTVFTDRDGILNIDQSGDGINWDATTEFVVSASSGSGFEVDVINPYWRVRLANSSVVNQSVLRLYAYARDIYGEFLAAATPPSEGGAWAVLFFSPQADDYVYAGRFDGADGFAANGSAAVSSNVSGKYASFAVGTGTVSDEAVTRTSEHTPDSF